MKKIGSLICTIAISLHVIATQQEPDKLLFNNLTLRLNTGWGHPSPLETYFFQQHIPYPFQMLSTANYRGHIASWVIENDQFFLKEIYVDSRISKPDKYGIKSVNGTGSPSSLVLADWFNGVLKCYYSGNEKNKESGSTFYFQLRGGKVIAKAELKKEDYTLLSNISINDTTDKELINKYQLLLLNNNYIAYYYRLNESDAIFFNNRNCRLNTGVEMLSPVFGLYNNNHLEWPFNWENTEKSGAPNCTWKIVNDSLLLTKLRLFYGTRFDSIDKEEISLSQLFPERVSNNQVFADWVTSVHLIVYGVDKSYGSGFHEFRPTEFTYCRFEKGILKESYSIPANFDMNKNKDSLDPRLKKLMNDY